MKETTGIHLVYLTFVEGNLISTKSNSEYPKSLFLFICEMFQNGSFI